MTDYGELIARAVAALEKSTGASRRALYGRMRTALVEALRKVDPPLSESEITRERLSLEEAIRKVEAEAIHRPWIEAPGASTLVKIAAGERPASDQESDVDRSIASGLEPAPDVPLPNSEPMPEEKPNAISVGEDEAHSPVLVSSRSQEWETVPPKTDAARQPFADLEVAGRQPAARELLAGTPSNVPDLDRFRLSLETAFSTAKADPANLRPEGKRDEKPAADSEVPLARLLDQNPSREAFPEGPHAAHQAYGCAAVSVPVSDDFILSVERALRNAQATGAGSQAEVKRDDAKRADPSGTPLPGRAELRGARPEARREETGDTVSPWPAQSRQLFARAAARAVDLDRFERPLESRKLKRRNESLPRMTESEPRIAPRPAAPQPLAPQKHPPAATAAEPSRRSKRMLISGFLGVFMVITLALAVYWLRTPLKAVLIRNSALQLGLRSTVSPPSADRLGQAGQQGSTAGPTGASQGTASAAVAQRAVLLDEDPNVAQGKRYTGSVIWRTETISPGPREASELSVKGTVEIPERHIKMTVSIQRNTDKELPASHVVEIMFNLPADFPSGGISDLQGIRMKQAEEEPGAPLAGATAKVTSEYYLTGLSASDADMPRNLELLKNRAWFSIWIVYSNGRHGILTIEKGAPGDSAFKEAFAAWGG